MTQIRQITYQAALREGLSQAMAEDPSVYVMGLGVPGPTGIFGTTTGLLDAFGPDRVMDMPSSEQGMTGIALGTTLAGYRPVLVHMRVDFSVLAMDQMVNQVAKWHFMYGGKMRAPMVFRMIIGRGWGQGPQHSQSLQSWFAHVPGMRVVMPTTPRDAKGMMIAAVRDDAPVFIFEHRWLYGISGEVPEEPYEIPLRGVSVARSGGDVTIAATSYMVLEALRAADLLSSIGIEAEVVDVRALAPLQVDDVVASVNKTGALVVADTGGIAYGAGAEILSAVIEGGARFTRTPVRVGLPFTPSPTSPSLAEAFFPRSGDIVAAVARQFDIPAGRLPPEPPISGPWHDQPDPSFTGPY